MGVVTLFGVGVGQRCRMTSENVDPSVEALQANNQCVPGRGNNICNDTEARGRVNLEKMA